MLSLDKIYHASHVLKKVVRQTNRKVMLCHVLRYAPFYVEIKKRLLAGEIGKIMDIQTAEHVSYHHFTMGYVRGKWNNQKECGASSLLAKCCHDLDIIQWLLDKPCKKVQSFGSLTHFTPANAPEGAPVRCVDGGCPVAETCPYNCMKLYYDDKKNYWFRGAATRGKTADFIPTDEEVMEALKTTDYGLCVYQANNDVVDHQVVNMEFEGGQTVTLTMTAFTNHCGRQTRIFGTRGMITGDSTNIKIYDFLHNLTATDDFNTVVNNCNNGISWMRKHHTVRVQPFLTVLFLYLYDS